jgi:signal transduction histidine kinase
MAMNNVIYYFLSKHTLEENMRDRLESLATQIKISIENSRIASIYLDKTISENLRTASLAIQHALDPDVEKVSQDELKQLAKILNIDTITLLKKTSDDIMLYKSSDPKEEGVSTKSWKPWYQAFQQLFEDYQVTIDWGLSLPNFWTGPFEYSSTDPKANKIEKYGYYYDGSTNYIIDPIVSDKKHKEFEDKGGVNAILNDIIKYNDHVLEITAFNPLTFGTGEMKKQTENGVLSYNSPRQIIYGEYQYSTTDDRLYVQKAALTKQSITYIAQVNGHKVLKFFMPVMITPSADMTDKNGKPIELYVLSLVSDYSNIQQTLNEQFTSLAVDIIIVTVISLILLALIIRFISKTRERDVRETQEAYIDDINNMFTAIHGQRHDFLNHMNTVYAMVSLRKFEALQSYVNELIEDISVTNEIITIGQPAISALIQSKSAIALQMKISFTYEFENLENFALGIRSVDIVKIIGNLIDNAFDAVFTETDEKRRVDIKGWVQDNMLNIIVTNPGRIDSEKAFESGYSTKKGSHNGIGLSITKQFVNKYHGTIVINRNQPDTVEFKVSIPLA